MPTHVFIIRTLTNLHVGSGDAHYGAVDKLVQRDPVTTYPTIHSTSIKGALREYFEENLGWKHADHPKKAQDKVEHIFGSAVGDSDNAKQGHYHFFSADLLALAVPDESDSPTVTFLRVSTEALQQQFINKAELTEGFISKGGKAVFDAAIKTKGLDLNNISIDKFKKGTDDLPVIARNQLENGISNNLWYEEIVPRETLFGWLVQTNGKYEDDFINAINGKIIQIGANATVGYGFCQFIKIN